MYEAPYSFFIFYFLRMVTNVSHSLNHLHLNCMQMLHLPFH